MRICVLGAGNMGSWFVKELSQEHEVALCSRTKEKAEIAAKSGRNVRVLSDFSEIADFAPELLINAVTLQNTVAAFSEALKYLPQNCVLCDVASIKGEIPEYYKRWGRKFASVHPMFGPTFANVENLADENAVIIRESDAGIAGLFRSFFKRLKLNIFEYTFREHDEMMAYSLTVPFASTLVFAACMDAKAVPGTTFRKHAKIAKGLLSEDDHLLSEILFNPHSLRQLEKITARLEYLKHMIREKEYEELKKFLDNLRKNIK